MTYRLLDGEQLNSEHPDTFHIDSLEERSNVAVGDFVKLGFMANGAYVKHLGRKVDTERMWVIVEGRLPDGSYYGVLNNDPYALTDIQCGDRVNFAAKHILDIMQASKGH